MRGRSLRRLGTHFFFIRPVDKRIQQLQAIALRESLPRGRVEWRDFECADHSLNEPIDGVVLDRLRFRLRLLEKLVWIAFQGVDKLAVNRKRIGKDISLAVRVRAENVALFGSEHEAPFMLVDGG